MTRFCARLSLVVIAALGSGCGSSLLNHLTKSPNNLPLTGSLKKLFSERPHISGGTWDDRLESLLGMVVVLKKSEHSDPSKIDFSKQLDVKGYFYTGAQNSDLPHIVVVPGGGDNLYESFFDAGLSADTSSPPLFGLSASVTGTSKLTVRTVTKAWINAKLSDKDKKRRDDWIAANVKENEVGYWFTGFTVVQVSRDTYEELAADGSFSAAAVVVGSKAYNKTIGNTSIENFIIPDVPFVFNAAGGKSAGATDKAFPAEWHGKPIKLNILPE